MDTLIIATQRVDAHTVRAYTCAGPRASLDATRLLAVAASDHASAYSLAAGVADRYLGSFHPIRHHEAPDATGDAPRWLHRRLDYARFRAARCKEPHAAATRQARLLSEALVGWGTTREYPRATVHGAAQALRDARKVG